MITMLYYNHNSFPLFICQLVDIIAHYLYHYYLLAFITIRALKKTNYYYRGAGGLSVCDLKTRPFTQSSSTIWLTLAKTHVSTA